MRSRAAILLLPVAMLAGGCGITGILGGTDAQVSFFSEPPGARVIVDKKDTGFVTPCRISLASRDDHKVELDLPGYAPARLTLDPEIDHEVTLWKDMSLDLGSWRFPLWLNLKDSVPVKFEANLKPGRVFVRLQRPTPQ